MISKGTMKTIAYTIADSLFHKRCVELDKNLFKWLDEALDQEKLSKERKERIKKNFYSNILRGD